MTLLLLAIIAFVALVWLSQQTFGAERVVPLAVASFPELSSLSEWEGVPTPMSMIEFVVHTKRSGPSVHVDARLSVCVPGDQRDLAIEALEEQIEKLSVERVRLQLLNVPQAARV